MEPSSLLRRFFIDATLERSGERASTGRAFTIPDQPELSSGGAGERRRDVGVAEVGSLEQKRFSGELCQGVREAVAEVQAGLVAAALPEVAVGVPGDTGLAVCHRFDAQFRGIDQLVEAAAGDGVTAGVDDDRGLQVVGGGDLPDLCPLDGMRAQQNLSGGGEANIGTWPGRPAMASPAQARA